jgi:hypothetical protein
LRSSKKIHRYPPPTHQNSPQSLCLCSHGQYSSATGSPLSVWVRSPYRNTRNKPTDKVPGPRGMVAVKRGGADTRATSPENPRPRKHGSTKRAGAPAHSQDPGPTKGVNSSPRLEGILQHEGNLQVDLVASDVAVLDHDVHVLHSSTLDVPQGLVGTRYGLLDGVLKAPLGDHADLGYCGNAHVESLPPSTA